MADKKRKRSIKEPLLLSQTALELDKYRQYLQGNGKRPDLARTREFLDDLTAKCAYKGESFANYDWNFYSVLWKALRKTTGREDIKKIDEVRELMQGYMQDLTLVANSDQELFDYGSHILATSRIGELQKFLVNLSHQLLASSEGYKRYAA